MVYAYNRVEQIMEKGENAGGYHIFFLIPQCFLKPSSGLLKVGIVWERVKDMKLHFTF